jgi:hypothetical protein
MYLLEILCFGIEKTKILETFTCQSYATNRAQRRRALGYRNSRLQSQPTASGPAESLRVKPRVQPVLSIIGLTVFRTPRAGNLLSKTNLIPTSHLQELSLPKHKKKPIHNSTI